MPGLMIWLFKRGIKNNVGNFFLPANMPREYDDNIIFKISTKLGEYLSREKFLNAKGIVSAITARIIVSAVVVLFVLLYSDIRDMDLFAQPAEKPSNLIAAAEVLNEPYPRLIFQTVEPVNAPWKRTKNFGDKIDWIHANLFKTIQDQVQKFDYLFKPPKGEKRIVELSRFRIGVFGEGKINNHDNLDLNPLVDFDADIELPNMQRRMKFVITSRDPTALPGRDIAEQQDTALRAAVSQQWRKNLSADIGVRTRWRPELFANLVYGAEWKKGAWIVYPEQRFYWENESGFGEISTLAFDHWKNRWNTRWSSSIKWSEQDRETDHQNQQKDAGFRWSEVFIFGYATELLDETRLNRMISGDDVAHGWGLRLSAFGRFHIVEEYRAGVFYRAPLRKKWMYFSVGPEVNWMNANEWDREWMIKCGIEMLFWGGKDR